MSHLVSPHGSASVRPLLLPPRERTEALGRAGGLRAIPLDSRSVSDVLMLAMGAYTPLEGFMGHDDWRGSCADMRLTSGVFWPIPITLPVPTELADRIRVGEDVALTDGRSGEVLAILKVEEKYTIDKDIEADHVYRTRDTRHPGVVKLLQQGGVNLAGRVLALSEGEYPARYPQLYIRPAESRALFLEKGWSRVAAFQTRNPMHRSHEYLAKIAIEVLDGVFIHQVLGELKPGDIPAEVRTRAVQAMVDNYFQAGTVIQAGYPIEMRYAGPREALLHALIRQNFGCSHLIVGRDHAGVGDYYGTYAAQEIFDQFPQEEVGISIVRFEHSFFCKRCEQVVSKRTCPHDSNQHLVLSGTKVREMLSSGQELPSQFSRPEVAKVLIEAYKS